MIDGYKCRDGKVISVEYDKKDGRCEIEREYKDNIEEFLMALNIEEYLYDYRDKMVKLINENENEIKEWKDEKNARVTVMAVIQAILLTFSVFFKPIFIPIICGVFWFVYKKILKGCSKKIKELESEKDGAELTLEGIKEEIKNNKVNIRRLVNDDRVTKEDISSDYKQLNYVEELKELKKYLELWYVAGVNQKNFLVYMEDDSLEDEIGEDFSASEIKIIKRILTDRTKKRY